MFRTIRRTTARRRHGRLGFGQGLAENPRRRVSGSASMACGAGNRRRDQRPMTGGELGLLQGAGRWPGNNTCDQKESQTVYPHPSLEESESCAQSPRPGTSGNSRFPRSGQGRRVALSVEYLNSLATFMWTGRRSASCTFPAGELDLTAAVQPGGKHLLSIFVEALPLQGDDACFQRHEHAPGGEGPGDDSGALRRRLSDRHAAAGARDERQSRILGSQGTLTVHADLASWRRARNTSCRRKFWTKASRSRR